MKRLRVSVVIVNSDKILLMHRIKYGRDFYVCIGGGVEDDESIEDAAVREAFEECSLDVVIDSKLFEFEDNENKVVYYLVKDFSGEVKLGGSEALHNCSENSYNLEWVEISDLSQVNLFPKEICGVLIEKLGGM